MSAEEGLIALVDGNERLLEDGASSQKSVPVVVPVNQDFAASQPRNNESDMERGDRRRILLEVNASSQAN